MRDFIPGWSSISLAKNFNSRLEVLQGAKVIVNADGLIR